MEWWKKICSILIWWKKFIITIHRTKIVGWKAARNIKSIGKLEPKRKAIIPTNSKFKDANSHNYPLPLWKKHIAKITQSLTTLTFNYFNKKLLTTQIPTPLVFPWWNPWPTGLPIRSHLLPSLNLLFQY